MPDQQLTPTTSSFSKSPKGYTVTLMHTGTANGWNFSSPVLQSAAPLANLVLSAILAGLNGDPATETALQAALVSIVSGLLYELFKWIGTKFPKS